MTNKQNISFYAWIISLSFTLSSCSIYKQQFDCPPPAGIPCASVTAIEGMIVETDKGSDLLVKPEVNQDNHCFWCGSQKAGCAFPSDSSKCHRKIWICSQQNESCLTKGHYFQKSESVGPIVLEVEEVLPCTKQRKRN